MRILALETSSSTGSVAALDGDQVIANVDLGKAQRTAQSLAPTVQAILRRVNWEPRDVQLVAVTEGPGSFTGLRAGVTTAKVFAYATGASVVAVNTLEVIAAQSSMVSCNLWAVMDAQRQQVFAAEFAVSDNGRPEPVIPTQIIDNDVWLEQLVTCNRVTGPGLSKLAKHLPHGVQVVSDAAWAPQAITLGHLAFLKHQSGARTDFWTLAPQYFRKSAAEEKFDQGLLK
ncbi:MAG: tRNA (adenosine(37)-N6)-threonylcarbamoyltransferase complex dimerization subunit type 1 TsaB [Planctomycetaceae bacterium]|nr:tRNA (adenosine(37)-N6)-threonylcarbamoyltransferase complex dimerization subunit type 1 TsaB [Planctomycetales bacterium]MCB9938340.1 tRNA (adenosine(37)-N6)-threonylcarbamoyltransferase complex dimerization subunit type 1 TsaB [Planctomycetaceae bacterium]